MTLSVIITFTLAILALAIKPGPGMLAMASKAISQGIGALLVFTVGMNLVKLAFLALVVVGWNVAEDDLIFVSILVKSLAATYLIWIGCKGLLNPDIDMTMPKNKTARHLENFYTGALVTLSNPFDIIFFAGVLPPVIDVGQIGLTEYLICAAIIVVVETGIALSYAVPMSLSRDFFTLKLMRNINIAASFAIIIVGLIIGYTALPAKDLLSVF